MPRPTPEEIAAFKQRYQEAAAMGDEWYVTSVGQAFLENVLADVGMLFAAFAGVAREAFNQGLFDDPDTWINEMLRAVEDA